MDSPIISVKDVHKSYGRGHNRFDALKGVSFDIHQGESIAIVGKSGSGKSTIGKVLAGTETANEGRVQLGGDELDLPSGQRTEDQLRRMQFVYQLPRSAFNPVRKLRAALEYSASLAGHRSREDRRHAVAHATAEVGVEETLLDRYPHQLSGGQLQRLSIARALITQPEVLFLDEPTSALDVSVRGEILNLLASLRESAGLSMVLVTHDLDVVAYVTDRVLVLYRGEIVEEGATTDIVTSPRHPYTQALLTASNLPGPRHPVELGTDLGGDADYAGGCRLLQRCPHAEEGCSVEQRLVPTETGSVRCWKATPGC